MEVKVDKIVREKANINITRAALLSVEEAEKLPYYLRKYDYWWWLQSPGANWCMVTNVCNDGDVDYYRGNYVDNDLGRVRPALTLENLESSDLHVGDKFEFGGVKFEVVSNDIAFCIEDIGSCAFCEDSMATDANNYKVSDIKRFVDNWFTNAVRAADVNVTIQKGDKNKNV